MIRVSSRGSFRNTITWLDRLAHGDVYRDLDRYGRMGVEALSGATPVETGATARSWTYEIERSRSGVTISWSNTNENEGSRIALLIQYGHGTGTGGYVSGRDYINPAIRPIFDHIATEVWKKVMHG